MSAIDSIPKRANNFIDLTGRVFGRLTVVSDLEEASGGLFKSAPKL